MNNWPKHIAFIVDGNRRWAKEKGLPNVAGHKKAANQRVPQLIYHCLDLGIPYLTFWVWSTENWKRGQKFASLLFSILKRGLTQNLDQYVKKGIKLNTIGDLSKLPQDLVLAIEKAKKKSKKNRKITVTFAINYGGRDEIIRAVAKLNQSLTKKKFKLTEKSFAKYLDTSSLPDPDLIIRTGGEHRVSGFLLWQSQYAEFFFPKTYFPDFIPQKLDKILKQYLARQRRFGQ